MVQQEFDVESVKRLDAKLRYRPDAKVRAVLSWTGTLEMPILLFYRCMLNDRSFFFLGAINREPPIVITMALCSQLGHLCSGMMASLFSVSSLQISVVELHAAFRFFTSHPGVSSFWGGEPSLAERAVHLLMTCIRSTHLRPTLRQMAFTALHSFSYSTALMQPPSASKARRFLMPELIREGLIEICRAALRE